MAKDRARLVGASLYGPAPLGWVHIDLRGTQTVAIYGKNGVGKTKILAALASALQGIERPDSLAFLHYELAKTVETGDLEAQLALELQNAASDFAANVSLHSADLQEGSDEAAELRSAVSWMTKANLSASPFEEVAEALLDVAFLTGKTVGAWITHQESVRTITTELTNSFRVCLRPSGSEQVPAWSTALAGTRSQKEFWDDAVRFSRTPMLKTELLEIGAEPEKVRTFMESLGSRLPRLIDDYWAIPRDLLGDLGTWPAWAAVPYMEFGSVRSLPITYLAADTSDEELDQASRAVLTCDYVGERDLDLTIIKDRASKMTSSANGTIQSVIGTDVELNFDTSSPTHWLIHGLPRWRLRSGGSTWIELQDSSDAERMWARVAITLAIHASSEESIDSIVLIDEPERGLHPAAEHALPGALAAIGRDSDTSLVVTTHSARLLDDRHTSPVHAQRVAGLTTLHPVPLPVGNVEESLMRDQLGLARADLLHLTRVFVLVEGLHDEIVLEAMLGDLLRECHAKIIPLRGAKGLASLAEARYLYDYTDAVFVLVIDGLPRPQVESIVTALTGLALEGDFGKMREALEPLSAIRGGEARWLSELLSLASRNGRLSRIWTAPLSAPDIVAYLPPDEFVPNSDWGQLIDEWRIASGSRNPVDLKAWLTKRYRASFSADAIQRAASRSLPQPDIDELGAIIRRASGLSS